MQCIPSECLEGLSEKVRLLHPLSPRPVMRERVPLVLHPSAHPSIGTGALHMAPTCGAEDFKLAHELSTTISFSVLSIRSARSAVDERGRLVGDHFDADWLNGLKIGEANALV